MIKWVEIASSCSRTRNNLFSKILSEKYGIENSVSFIEEPLGNISEVIEEATSEYDFIRIGAGYGEAIVSHYPFSSEKINILKSADCLIKGGGRWWSRSATFHGLQKMVSSVAPGIDIEQKVLIVGVGAISRAVIATFIKMGFKKFSITNYIEEPAHVLIADIQKHYFSTECEYVPMENLILLSGDHTVVANTTPFSEGNRILKELYYFNYLSPGGIALDCVLDIRDTPFAQEARSVGAKVVEGYEIASWADTVWAKWCFNLDIDRDYYNRELKELLEVGPPIRDD